VGAQRWLQSSWIWLPTLLLLVFGGWALVSPSGSSPDDDYHLSSIWCSLGEQTDRCEFVTEDLRAVPVQVAAGAVCYAFDSTVSASCIGDLPGGLTATNRVNDVQRLYPTLFYRVMTLFVGPDVERSVLAMRFANALIASALLMAVLRLTPLGVRSAVLMTMVVGYIPLGLSVIPSTNPSSWTITGLLMLTALGVSLVYEKSWRNRKTIALATLMALSAVLVIGSRVDGMAYVVITVIVLCVYAGWRQLRRAWGATALLTLISGFAIWSYFTFGTPGGPEPMGLANQSLGLLTTNLLYLPELIEGALGGWNLGWIDTPMPPLVPITGMLALGALGYRGFISVSWRRAWAILLAGAMVIAVPLAFLQKEGLNVGEVVQPRYILPLLLLTLFMLTLGNRVDEPLPLAAPVAAAVGVAMTVSASLSFWAYAHRYAIGTDYPLIVLDIPLEWSFDVPVPFGLTVLVTVLASALFIGGSVAAVHARGKGQSTVAHR